MNKRDLNIVDYWNVISRQKYIIVAVALVVMLAMGGLLFVAPVTYQAITKVKLEKPVNEPDYLAQAFFDPYVEEIASQVAIVHSFPVLERVAQELLLLPSNASPELRKTDSYLRTIYDLDEKIRAVQEGSTTIIKIIAMGETGEAAAQLANTVAQTYQAYSKNLRSRRIEDFRRFTETQLTTIEGNLQQAEDALRQFREQKGQLFLTEEAKGDLIRVTNLEAQYDKAHQARLSATKQMRVLEYALTLVDFEQDPGLFEGIFTFDETQHLFQKNLTMMELLREREVLLIDQTPLHPQIQALNVKIHNLQIDMEGELASKIEHYREQEDLLKSRLEQLREKSQRFPQAAIQLSRLEREVKVNSELYAKLRANYEKIRLSTTQQIEEILILAPALIPQHPAKAIPDVLKGILSALMGLFFGMIAAFIRESIEPPIRKPQEIEQQLEVPILGMVPAFNDKALKTSARQELGKGQSAEKIEILSRLFCLVSPQSKLSEAIRTIRSNLQFACVDREVKTILMTNLGLANGRVSTSSRSATLVNLALLLAEDGKRVLLVDGNIRNPVIHEGLGLTREPGLTDALAEGLDWREHVRTSTDLMMGPLGIEQVMCAPELDFFDVLTAGTPSANPSKLLQSERLGELIHSMRDNYDYVLLDAAPLLAVADSLVLGSKVDGVVLLCQDTGTSEALWQRTKGLLDQARAVLLGVVLTNAKSEALRNYVGEHVVGNVTSKV